MRFLLLGLLFCLSLHAEVYTIQWQKNDQVEDYAMDVLCIETGFSTLKKYSKDITSVDINLSENQTYKIFVLASSKNGELVASNTLTIKTQKPKPFARLKAPFITAIKKNTNE